MVSLPASEIHSVRLCPGERGPDDDGVGECTVCGERLRLAAAFCDWFESGGRSERNRDMVGSPGSEFWRLPSTRVLQESDYPCAPQPKDLMADVVMTRGRGVPVWGAVTAKPGDLWEDRDSGKIWVFNREGEWEILI